MIVKIPPANKPISVDAAKNFLYIASSSQDAEIQLFIDSVVAEFERITSRTLINTTFTAFFDSFSDSIYDEITLRRAIAQSISEVRYLDEDENWQVLDPLIYRLARSYHDFSSVVLRPEKSWPTISNVPNAVEIDFVAGYGPNPNLVPPDIRNALLQCIGALYESRGQSEECAGGKLPERALRVINGYKIKRMLVP